MADNEVTDSAKPNWYEIGRSGSTQRLAANANLSTSSTPDEGDTKNVPEDGGALVTTTIDAEAVATPNEKVSVAPAGSELAGRAKLITTGD